MFRGPNFDDHSKSRNGSKVRMQAAKRKPRCGRPPANLNSWNTRPEKETRPSDNTSREMREQVRFTGNGA